MQKTLRIISATTKFKKFVVDIRQLTTQNYLLVAFIYFYEICDHTKKICEIHLRYKDEFVNKIEF